MNEINKCLTSNDQPTTVRNGQRGEKHKPRDASRQVGRGENNLHRGQHGAKSLISKGLTCSRKTVICGIDAGRVDGNSVLPARHFELLDHG